MYRSLYFKIILIFVIFMITVMTVVGTVLLNSVSGFFADEFISQIDGCFSADGILRAEMESAAGEPDSVSRLIELVEASSDYLGLDVYRSVYILDMSGKVLASAGGGSESVVITRNILSAMNGEDGRKRSVGSSSVDYAVVIGNSSGTSSEVPYGTSSEVSSGNSSGNSNIGNSSGISDEVSSGNPSETSGIVNTGNTGNTSETSSALTTDGAETTAVHSALYPEAFANGVIVYVIDTQEDVANLSWQLLSIVLQALLFGIVMAIVLSFFLAKAITNPIQNLTVGAQLIMAGKFEHEIDVHSRDEIGVLTTTFNDMKTVLKNTLDEVSGEREKLVTVFSYLKDGVIAFGDDGKVININPYAVKLFGGNYGGDFGLEKMIALLGIDRSEAKLVKDDYSKSVVFSDVKYEEKVFELNIGSFRYMNETHNGYNSGFITVIHDITSRYELDKSRREFVANVSHELRTPLTGIKGAVETVRMNPDIPPEVRDSFLDMALEESDSMLRIVRDLLTLSRLDNNKTQWVVSKFDLKQSLIHVCSVVRSEAEAHRHSIIFDENTVLPEITGDKERIAQVLINIISNSIKYTPDGGRIVISAAADKKNVRIDVTDNGIGIPESDIPRLFERFYRVEKSRSSDSGGTGLGLAIVKEIVEAHGGTVGVRSKIGEGSCVSVTLPVETKLVSS